MVKSKPKGNILSDKESQIFENPDLLSWQQNKPNTINI